MQDQSNVIEVQYFQAQNYSPNLNLSNLHKYGLEAPQVPETVKLPEEERCQASRVWGQGKKAKPKATLDRTGSEQPSTIEDLEHERVRKIFQTDMDKIQIYVLAIPFLFLFKSDQIVVFPKINQCITKERTLLKKEQQNANFKNKMKKYGLDFELNYIEISIKNEYRCIIEQIRVNLLSNSNKLIVVFIIILSNSLYTEDTKLLEKRFQFIFKSVQIVQHIFIINYDTVTFALVRSMKQKISTLK
ncbi:Hypothetical_protein [Hexamita inflata]|uniref:Hypothetical_protein n=1 Tax=Hexamita inflata TaxID=28002 RepID=A0AA86RMC3_9EUKA|nr:Hypothetical protein HINF_LOCUS62319 [Hexamita inflata]